MPDSAMGSFARYAMKEVAAVADLYSLEVRLETENVLSLIGPEVVIQMGVFPSHETNVTTTIRKVGDDRVFGLGLVVHHRNPTFDLGPQSIRTESELQYSITQQAKAILEYCGSLVKGDEPSWRELRRVADQRHREKYGSETSP